MDNKQRVVVRTEGGLSSKTFLLSKYRLPRGEGGDSLKIKDGEVIVSDELFRAIKIKKQSAAPLVVVANAIDAYMGSIGAASASILLWAYRVI